MQDHTFYNAAVHIVTLPILSKLTQFDLLPRQIVDTVCIYYLFLCAILFAWNFVLNAWTCAVIVSPSVSAFRSPIDSPRNVSSSLISCPSVCLYFQYTIIQALLCFLIFSLTALLILLLYVVCLRFWVSAFTWFDYFTTFAAILIIKFTANWLFSWLLLIFNNSSSLLLCADILKYRLAPRQSVTTSVLPLSFLRTA